MQFVRATLVAKGRPILADVAVLLREPGDGAAGSRWHGYFRLPAGEALLAGGPYWLALEDGRSARVALLTTHFNARAETPVLFRLLGAWAKPGGQPAEPAGVHAG